MLTAGRVSWFNLYMETTSTTNTPGFNCRLSIYFTTAHSGRRMAFRYSWRQMRAFRMPVADAELFIAQGQADRMDGHPMKAS